jgi:hypothetical protein
MWFRRLNLATALRLVRRGGGSIGVAGLVLITPWPAIAPAASPTVPQRPTPTMRDRVLPGLPGDETGFAVAISGSTAVISAPGSDGGSGAAYIYTHTGAGWRRTATIPNPQGSAEKSFSWAVAVSSTKAGTYVVIGGHDLLDSDLNYVYIYEDTGKSWQQVAKLGDPQTNPQDLPDLFGSSLAISSSTLVVGAPYANSLSGFTYIYEHEGAAWILKATKPDPLDRPFDFFSQSVAVYGDNVIIGAHDEVYAYAYVPGHGWPKAVLLRNPGSSKNFYGQSVSLTEDMAMVGAPNTNPSGAVYVFKKTGKSWKIYQTLTAPATVNGNQFGSSVAVADTKMLIGMPYYGNPNCGTAFLFGLSGDEWQEQRQIADPQCTAGDEFGYSVDLSSGAGVFGAPQTGDSSGAFYFQQLP